MVRIEGNSVIGRPVEMVFDFVADQQNEPARLLGLCRLWAVHRLVPGRT